MAFAFAAPTADAAFGQPPWAALAVTGSSKAAAIAAPIATKSSFFTIEILLIHPLAASGLTGVSATPVAAM